MSNRIFMRVFVQYHGPLCNNKFVFVCHDLYYLIYVSHFRSAVNLVPDPSGLLAANSIPLSAFSPPVPVRDAETNATTPGHYGFSDW